eukprot:76318-Alexandrium_andersonii.AAC.1
MRICQRWLHNDELSELEQPSMQNHDRRLELELRAPRNRLEIDPRTSRAVRSAPVFGLILYLKT